MQHHSATWALDKIKRLVELWCARVLTPGEIAAELGVTRNAVIGKANRMHLEAKTLGRPRAGVRFAPRPPPAPPKPEPAPPPEAPVSLGLTFWELEPGQCRYAEGDKPYLFCGHEIQPGSSYCPYHHRVCYYPLSPARRELARPLSQWRGMGHG